MAQKQAPSQAIEPCFTYGRTAPLYGHPFTAIAGAMIATEERRAHPQRPVLDGEGARQRRIIEIWRANTYGRYKPA